jgi:hypothetical protein
MNTSSDHRNRVVLQFKRDIIEQYLTFAKAPRIMDDGVYNNESTDHDSSEDDSKEKPYHVRTIKKFLSDYNRDKSLEGKLVHGCVFKWWKSFERGELHEWNGMNPLTKRNSKAKKIMEHIYHSLKTKFPDTAYYNKIVRKSTISPEKYGVVAKRFISKGTFLGFFTGVCVTSSLPLADETAIPPVTIDDCYMFRLGSYSFIDGGDFTSCFARYYAWSRDIHKQNVSVHKLDDWTNPNRAVCFMANKDIEKGQEFIVPINQDYVIGKKKYKNFKRAPCNDNCLSAPEKARLFGN